MTLLLLRAWSKPLAIAALIAGAWWWHAHRAGRALDDARAQGRAEVQALWNAAQHAQQAADADANQANRQTEGENRDRVSTAQSTRAQTAGAHAADLAGLRTERDRLRHSLATALDTIRSCGVPGPAADAAADRAAAVQRVLEAMEGEAAELARAADAHAADSLMYQQAWPKGAAHAQAR